MLRKKITFIDYNGKTQTKECYFNLNEVEITRLEAGIPGGEGFEGFVAKMDPKKDPESIMHLFEKVITESYGFKDDDGQRFRKDPDETLAFKESPAYSALFVQLLSNTDEASSFFNSMLTKTTTDRKDRKKVQS